MHSLLIKDGSNVRLVSSYGSLEISLVIIVCNGQGQNPVGARWKVGLCAVAAAHFLSGQEAPSFLALLSAM